MRINVVTDNSSLVTSRRVHTNETKIRVNDFRLYATKLESTKLNNYDYYFNPEDINYVYSDGIYDFFDNEKRYWPADGKSLDFYAFHMNHKNKTMTGYGVMADFPELKTNANNEVGVEVDNVSVYTDYQKAQGAFPNFDVFCVYYMGTQDNDLLQKFLTSKGYTESEFNLIWYRDDFIKDAAQFVKENLEDYKSKIEAYAIAAGYNKLPIAYQDDMLYDVQRNKNKDNTGGTLNLTFHHALTKVSFKATVASKNLAVGIANCGFQLRGFKNKAKFSFGYPDYDGGCKWEMYDDASSDEYCNMYFSENADNTTFREDTDDKYKNYAAYMDTVLINSDVTFGGLTWPSSVHTMTYYPALLIPQKVAGGTVAADGTMSGLFLKLSCYIAYIADVDGFNTYLTEYLSSYKPSGINGYFITEGILRGRTNYPPSGVLLFGDYNTFNNIMASTTTYKTSLKGWKDLYIPLPTVEWQAGKSYVYNLVFDTDAADKTPVYDENGNEVMNVNIAISTMITDWKNSSLTSINN